MNLEVCLNDFEKIAVVYKPTAANHVDLDNLQGRVVQRRFKSPLP